MAHGKPFLPTVMGNHDTDRFSEFKIPENYETDWVMPPLFYDSYGPCS